MKTKTFHMGSVGSDTVRRTRGKACLQSTFYPLCERRKSNQWPVHQRAYKSLRGKKNTPIVKPTTEKPKHEYYILTQSNIHDDVWRN